MNKQKLQLNRVGRPEGELSCPEAIAEPKRKKEDSYFLARTQPTKNHGLCLLWPSQLPFPFYNSVLLLPCREFACDSPWLQTLNWNSLLIPSKLIFAGEICGSLFVSGQQRFQKTCFSFIKIFMQVSYTHIHKTIQSDLLKAGKTRIFSTFFSVEVNICRENNCTSISQTFIKLNFLNQYFSFLIIKLQLS